MSSHRVDNASRITGVSGDFNIDESLTVGGSLTVNKGTANEFKMPITQGVAGQVPVLNSSAVLEWATPTSGISNQITNVDGTSHITSVAAGTNDNVDVTCDGALSAKFLPDLLTLYAQIAAPRIRFSQLDNLATVGIRAPTSGVTTWDLTLPTAVPARANQALVATTGGVASWTDAALDGGNTLAAALSLGTNDAFGLNLKTQGSTVLSLDVSGNITGTGGTWTQNSVQLQFSAVADPAVSYTTPAVTSFTVPGGYTKIRAQLWGAGGALGGGSGAYTEITLNVSAGQTYWVISGAAGSTTTGGNIGGGNASGGGGNAAVFGGGGQYSALIRQNGSNYILLACAGGGGGGGGGTSNYGGGGGVAGTSGAQPGLNGVGGTAADGVTNGGNYAANSTTTGHTSLTFGGYGGTGVNGFFGSRAGGGGGYGGGGGGFAGGGGGNFVQAVSTVIASSTVTASSVTVGNQGTPVVNPSPPNSGDTNYVAGYGRGSASGTTTGGPGLAVITLTQIFVRSAGNVKTAGQLQMLRADAAQTVSVKAADTSASWTLTLPTSAGTTDQYLITDGSGATSWTTGTNPVTTATVAAAGTNQATATAVTAKYVKVTSGTGGVVLPSTTNKEVTIKNTSGALITIYPGGAGTIDGAVSTTLADAATARFVSSTANIYTSY